MNIKEPLNLTRQINETMNKSDQISTNLPDILFPQVKKEEPRLMDASIDIFTGPLESIRNASNSIRSDIRDFGHGTVTTIGNIGKTLEYYGYVICAVIVILAGIYIGNCFMRTGETCFNCYYSYRRLKRYRHKHRIRKRRKSDQTNPYDTWVANNPEEERCRILQGEKLIYLDKTS